PQASSAMVTDTKTQAAGSPAMAQRQPEAERLLPKRPSRALHGPRNLFYRRLLARVRLQLSHVGIRPGPAFDASSSFACHLSLTSRCSGNAAEHSRAHAG